ncbi:uncharacterized protein MONOS_10623 [Monocercomonoides exilis]|uniref:uncharacterized protein n=1 Tax=Monocercomonoides exilis TaxID=2049356 RepID=UPI00355A86AF|nr:hypothetical protein MONOS_10623 [Monocercomonoides exilis]|eukprot:MONOS_10623.1-p1 / transcript=MONOS_10623.1 / gene=MONOS_10623 / organism=Monocercomonoides_exilis_PA203 / gene_product=unspecified product / transcript_product=unspecified product / location=Mono_scaffold00490:37587-40315(-) / protein_length=820 / sequence_SO=supercontig / SO=protein_coding / is_pseudo=false
MYHIIGELLESFFMNSYCSALFSQIEVQDMITILIATAHFTPSPSEALLRTLYSLIASLHIHPTLRWKLRSEVQRRISKISSNERSIASCIDEAFPPGEYSVISRKLQLRSKAHVDCIQPLFCIFSQLPIMRLCNPPTRMNIMRVIATVLFNVMSIFPFDDSDSSPTHNPSEMYFQVNSIRSYEAEQCRKTQGSFLLENGILRKVSDYRYSQSFLTAEEEKQAKRKIEWNGEGDDILNQLMIFLERAFISHKDNEIECFQDGEDKYSESSSKSNALSSMLSFIMPKRNKKDAAKNGKKRRYVKKEWVVSLKGEEKAEHDKELISSHEKRLVLLLLSMLIAQRNNLRMQQKRDSEEEMQPQEIDEETKRVLELLLSAATFHCDLMKQLEEQILSKEKPKMQKRKEKDGDFVDSDLESIDERRSDTCIFNGTETNSDARNTISHCDIRQMEIVLSALSICCFSLSLLVSSLDTIRDYLFDNQLFPLIESVTQALLLSSSHSAQLSQTPILCFFTLIRSCLSSNEAVDAFNNSNFYTALQKLLHSSVMNTFTPFPPNGMFSVPPACHFSILPLFTMEPSSYSLCPPVLLNVTLLMLSISIVRRCLEENGSAIPLVNSSALLNTIHLGATDVIDLFRKQKATRVIDEPGFIDDGEEMPLICASPLFSLHPYFRESYPSSAFCDFFCHEYALMLFWATSTISPTHIINTSDSSPQLPLLPPLYVAFCLDLVVSTSITATLMNVLYVLSNIYSIPQKMEYEMEEQEDAYEADSVTERKDERLVKLLHIVEMAKESFEEGGGSDLMVMMIHVIDENILEEISNGLF